MISYDLNKIRAIALDIDGVLSQNVILLPNDGTKPMRTSNVKDGYALQLAIKRGLKIVIISGGDNPAIASRYSKLGCKDIYFNITDKLTHLQHWCKQENIVANEVAYMGDDIPDAQCMKWVGCPLCPADAATDIKNIALYISPITGGNGCVRDIIEQILRAQHKWDTATSNIRSL